jgi:beta-galactosidase
MSRMRLKQLAVLCTQILPCRGFLRIAVAACRGEGQRRLERIGGATFQSSTKAAWRFASRRSPKRWPRPAKTGAAIAVALLLTAPLTPAVEPPNRSSVAAPGPRERLLMDFAWRFALGHATDVSKDFGHATGHFSYFAKAGYGAGAAGFDFDDSGWRTLNLPHDWAVEAPFDNRGSGSHGYKAIGRNFPESSVGWYRKSFFIPATDLGRRISVEFDGVFRDSLVWINGHYLGREEGGYSSFAYNVSEFLNYGSNNVIAVRVDASLEEGWFYEGAGIYRHVWLTKTDPLHVERHGTFVTSEVNSNAADITARVTVVNEAANTVSFELVQTLVGPDAMPVGEMRTKELTLKAGDTGEFSCLISVANPKLWSIETPQLHTLVTTLRAGGSVVDIYQTPFGIRSIRFDPNEGFFLNGKHVKLKGANNHQDHAGVGAAIPDALQEFRIARLKEFGGNAYRCAHNPPTPELLEACDRLGMLVIDENRLMGTSDFHLDHLRRLIVRDRNHPSVVLWSLGNEEWAIEGNEIGERITAAVQSFAKRLDPTRPVIIASSGGWGKGSSKAVEIMGYNYISHGNTDEHHAKFPRQPGIGTEECALYNTRGVYTDNRSKAQLRAYDWDPSDWGASAEQGWSHFADRPYLAGMFVWTGFDYRGEPTPFGWPAIGSQFGILDTCGFAKDSFYYFKSWWSDEPVLHVFPHWNWAGQEGQSINVWTYSNCDEVELFLNGQTAGRQKMKKNSHLEWSVKYAPGTLLARGYKQGREILATRVETTGEPAAVHLTPHRPAIKADGEDVSVITVQVNDAQGRFVPTASNEITFELSGPGRIIGVGNGDPASHEPDQFVEKVSAMPVTNWRVRNVDGTDHRPEVGYDFDDSGWQTAFNRRGGRERAVFAPAGVYRGLFTMPAHHPGMKVALLARSLGEAQSFFLNGKVLAENVRWTNPHHEFALDPGLLRPGTNVIAIVATPLASGRESRDSMEKPAAIRVVIPPAHWKRSLFNGLAQIIVQSTREPGEIILTAKGHGLTSGVFRIESQPASLRPVVAAK